jgi:DNA-binding NarL/FixJ family response regulator
MEQLEASKAVALRVLGTKDEAQQEAAVLAAMIAAFTASQARKAEHVAAIEQQLAGAEVCPPACLRLCMLCTCMQTLCRRRQMMPSGLQMMHTCM